MLPLLGAAALHSGVTKSIHQRRPVERGVGGCRPKGTTSDGGMGGRKSTGRPEKTFFWPKTKTFWQEKKIFAQNFFGCFGSLYWSPPLTSLNSESFRHFMTLNTPQDCGSARLGLKVKLEYLKSFPCPFQPAGHGQ